MQYVVEQGYSTGASTLSILQTQLYITLVALKRNNAL